ncbi:MAG: hypothetical protein RR068_01015 [Hafnia sp.]
MITITSFSNIKNMNFVNEEQSAINLIADIDGVGEELPFTANSTDVMDYGRELYQRAINGDFGEIVEYVAPVEVESKPLLKATGKTVQELSIEAYALQCAVDAGSAADEQIEELSTLRATIARLVGKKINILCYAI